MQAAFNLNAGDHSQALERARDFFQSKSRKIPEGIERLPTAWLAGLPGLLWSPRKSHWTRLPYAIQRIACVNGTMVLSFAQEEERRNNRMTPWDRIRIMANRCVYPSRWRPLLRRHRLELWAKLPELRQELQLAAPAEQRPSPPEEE